MDGIQVEYSYPAPPDVLWRALTERAKIAGWWGDNDFVPETGHHFTVSTIGLAALAGPIQCTVLELEPERRLVMSWRVGTTRATVSLLVEPSSTGSVLVLTRHGSVGPAAPTDVERALEELFDERLRNAVTRAPAEVGSGASGSLSLWGNGPAPFRNLHGPVAPPAYGLDTPRGRSPVPAITRPTRVWLAIAVVTLVAIAAIACLFGMLGPDSHGTGGMLGPANPNATGPGGDPIYPAAGPNGPAGPAGGQAGQPGQPAQSGQPRQPGQPGPTFAGPGPTGVQPTTNPPVANLSVGYTGTGLSVLTFQVTVTVTNTGGASGQWSAVGVTLTGSGLTLSGISSTVTHILRGSTHCFTPSPSVATVAPGGSVSFSFTVVANLAALLGNVGGVTLNSAPCV